MYAFSSSHYSVYHQKLQTDAQHGMVFGYAAWSLLTTPREPSQRPGGHALGTWQGFLNGAFGEHPKLFWKEDSIIILDSFSVKCSMLYIYVQHIFIYKDPWCCIFCMDQLCTMRLSIPTTVTVSFLGLTTCMIIVDQTGSARSSLATSPHPNRSGSRADEWWRGWRVEQLFWKWLTSWESKGIPLMPPPQEIGPKNSGIINHHDLPFFSALLFWGVLAAISGLFGGWPKSQRFSGFSSPTWSANWR